MGAAAGKPDAINMLVWQLPCIVTAWSPAAVPPVSSLRAGVIPFVIGAYEFGKRILIQRRCQNCEGSGLVQRGRYLRKCPEASAHAPCMLHAGHPAALCLTCSDRLSCHYPLSAVWWILPVAGLGQVLHVYCNPWQRGASEGPERADISLLQGATKGHTSCRRNRHPAYSLQFRRAKRLSNSPPVFCLLSTTLLLMPSIHISGPYILSRCSNRLAVMLGQLFLT